LTCRQPCNDFGKKASAFYHQRADALVLTIAPTLVGGYKGVGNLDLGCKSQLPQIRPLHSQMLGQDLIMWGNLHYLEPALA